MKKTSFVIGLGLLFLGNSLIAQTKPEWNEVFNKINTEVSKNSNAYNSLKISSETIGHRLTGSENGKKAEQYAFDLLKSYGFTNLRFEPFEVEYKVFWKFQQMVTSFYALNRVFCESDPIIFLEKSIKRNLWDINLLSRVLE